MHNLGDAGHSPIMLPELCETNMAALAVFSDYVLEYGTCATEWKLDTLIVAGHEFAQGNIIGDYRRKSFYRIDFSAWPRGLCYTYITWYCTFEMVVFQYEVSSLEASHEMIDTLVDYSLKKSFLCPHGCLFRSMVQPIFYPLVS